MAVRFRPGALILLTVALTGCKSSPREVPVPGASAPATGSRTPASTLKEPGAPPGAAAPGALPPPELKVLVNGAAPRRELRYSFVPGQSTTFNMKQRVGVRLGIGDAAPPSAPATETTLTMRIEVTKVQERVATLAFEVTRAELPGASAAARAMLESLETYRGVQTVDDRGVLTHFTHDTSGVADAQLRQLMDSMKQSMNQVLVPLPQAAVGIGATWQVTTRSAQSGIDLTQVATHRVTALDDRHADLDVDLVQSAPSSTVSPAGLPPGITVDLVSMESKGSAKMHLDFSTLVPRSDLDLSVTMKMKPSVQLGAGADELIDMSMTMKLSLVPIP